MKGIFGTSIVPIAASAVSLFACGVLAGWYYRGASADSNPTAHRDFVRWEQSDADPTGAGTRPVHRDAEVPVDGYLRTVYAAQPYERTLQFASILSRSGAENLESLYGTLISVIREGGEVDKEMGMFLDWAARTDPTAALGLLARDGFDRKYGDRLVSAWAVSDPAGAIRALKESVLDPKRYGLDVYGALLDIQHPNAAVVAELLPESMKNEKEMADVQSLVKREGFPAAIKRAIPHLSELSSQGEMTVYFQEIEAFTLATRLPSQDIRETIESTLKTNPELGERMIGIWGDKLVGELVSRSPQETMHWLLNSESAGEIEPLIDNAIAYWIKADTEACLEFVKNTPMSKGQTIKLLTGIANGARVKDPELSKEAWGMIDEVKNRTTE